MWAEESISVFYSQNTSTVKNRIDNAKYSTITNIIYLL